MTPLEVAGLISIAGGLFFFLGTVAGVHRFPDLYTRLHGASKGDTLSSMLVILGLILMSWEGFSSAGVVRVSKLLGIILFLSIASPAASHALADAAYKRKIPFWKGPNRYRIPGSDQIEEHTKEEEEG